MSQRRRRHGVPVLDFVAGNGLVNRRALLGSGITIAGGLAAAGTATGAAAEPLADAPWRDGGGHPAGGADAVAI